MTKDIKFLDEIMSYKNRKDVKDNRFFWIYLFTNENIKAYYSNIDFNNKSVLTVTSSGDHILNAILSGANEVSGFDINPLAKYYVELKIAAIKSLTLEEFIMFFYDKKLLTYKYFFNKKIYTKFSNNLSGEYKEFWDYFFDTYNKRDIFESYLISDDYLTLKGLLEVNLYLNKDNYYKLREILKNININYYDVNLKDMKSINKKFDILILSNIPAHLEKIYDKELLKSFKESILSVCHNTSKVVVNYFYDVLLEHSYSKIIYNIDKVSEFFSDEEYEYKQIESAFNTQMIKGLRMLSTNYDKILISKDKK